MAAETDAETEGRDAAVEPDVLELLERLTKRIQDLEQHHLATEMIVGLLASKAPAPDLFIRAVEGTCAAVTASPDAADRQAFIETSETIIHLVRASRDARSHA